MPSSRRTRTGTGRGAAAPAITSSGGTSPRSRSRSFARMASRSASGNRSVLFRSTIDRFPCRTSAESGSNSVRTRSWSSTKTIRSARAASSRASCSRAIPPAPISERPGVSVRKTVPSTPWSVYVWLSPRWVVPIVASVLPTSRPSSALISEVLPAEPVPKMTTWNSRRSRPARISPSSRSSSALACLVAHLADHALGLVRLDGRGLDHVGRDRCGRRTCTARPRPPGHASQPDGPDRQQDDQDDQERQPEPARFPGEPLVHLVQRADQPGRQPERGAHEDHRQRDIGVRRPGSHAQVLILAMRWARPTRLSPEPVGDAHPTDPHCDRIAPSLHPSGPATTARHSARMRAPRGHRTGRVPRGASSGRGIHRERVTGATSWRPGC